jgi:hypothetical protein
MPLQCTALWFETSAESCWALPYCLLPQVIIFSVAHRHMCLCLSRFVLMQVVQKLEYLLWVVYVTQATMFGVSMHAVDC